MQPPASDWIRCCKIILSIDQLQTIDLKIKVYDLFILIFVLN